MSDLERPRSRWRVVNFWATWCQPCIAEMPGLKTFAERNPEIDLVLVNLDLPKLQSTKVQAMIRRLELEELELLGLNHPDPAGAMNAVPGWPDSIPVTFVIDPSGMRTKQFNTAVQPALLERAIP